MLLSGLRFDNQQWQDEHGLGLSQIGIDRVEVIKGPASLLYGSDAIGGVINIIEEKPQRQSAVRQRLEIPAFRWQLLASGRASCCKRTKAALDRSLERILGVGH